MDTSILFVHTKSKPRKTKQHRKDNNQIHGTIISPSLSSFFSTTCIQRSENSIGIDTNNMYGTLTKQFTKTAKCRMVWVLYLHLINW